MPQVIGVSWSGDQDIDGLLTGFKWASTALTFSFPADGSFYGVSYEGGTGQNTIGFAQLNAAQQEAALSVFAQYAAVSNLQFTQITETATEHAVLREAQTGQPFTADTYYPDVRFADSESGDSWYGNRQNWYQEPVKGGYGYQTFMHEIGLALGLKDDTTGTALTFAHDSMEYTVETYRSYVGASVTYGYSNETWGYAQSLMMYDVAAIQQMYGANYTTNATNTVYSWDPATGEEFINGVGQGAPGGNRIFLTIWDGNGVDTYDFSNYTTNLKVDLQPGHWSTVSTAQLADLDGANPGVHMAAGNIANALEHDNDSRSLIENAIGGSGNDIITGNVANNALSGGGGGDILYGLAGNDAIDGGAGNDTVVFSGPRASYQISRAAGGALQVADLRAGSPDGTDLVSSVEYFSFSDGAYSVNQLGIPAPTVNAANISLFKGQSIAASSLFSTGSAIVAYQFYDSTAAVGSGSLTVNGAVEGANQTIDVFAAELSQTRFEAGGGPGTDALSVRVFDGSMWSAWKDFSVTTVNRAPIVTAADMNATKGEVFAAGAMFATSDADAGDAIVKYQLWDSNAAPSSGHFLVDGVAQEANVAIDVTPAQLTQAAFQTVSGSDLLWARAWDGQGWGAWTSFTVTAPIDHAPTVSVADVGVPLSTNIPVSELFTTADADGDAIAKYQFWDSSAEPASGHFVLNGVAQNANENIDVLPADLAQTSYLSSSAPSTDKLWVRTFDGLLWSDWQSFNVSAPAVLAPKVQATDQVLAKNGEIAASSIFTAYVPFSAKAMTDYQFWDSTPDIGSGHFAINGVAQGPDQAIDVSPELLAQTTFQAGAGSVDHLWVRASDGTVWSNWIPFTISAPNHAPIASADDVSASKGESFNVSTLFTASDADASDTVSKYQFWDSTTDPYSGQFFVNGIAQDTNVAIEVSPDQLAQTSFQTNSGTDDLWVRAFDGMAWGAWKEFYVAAPTNHAPVTGASNVVVNHGQSLAASSLFTASDPDGDTITQYQFWDDHYSAVTTDDNPALDSSGYFSLSGVREAEGVAINVTAAQLSSLTFEPQEGDNLLWVRAFDGLRWGAWQEFHVVAPLDQRPVATAADVTASHGQNLDASSLFTVTDAEGDIITKYQFWDSTADAASGHFVVNGVAQGVNVNIDVSSSELAQTSFQTGSGADDLWVRAFDGTAWGAWTEFHVTAPVDQAPVAIASDVAASHGDTLVASSLFTASDPDGDTITQYQFWDDHYSAVTTDDNPASDSSGYFSLSGMRQPEGAAINVTAAQLSSVTFEPQEGDNLLWVRAFDGTAWGAWQEFHVTAPVDQAPVASAPDISLSVGATVSASSLFTVSDAESDAITEYQFWDSTADPKSGHFVVNDVAQGVGQAIDVLASQLDEASFVAASAPMTDDLWVRAFDGVTWGGWVEFHATSHTS